jgi:uncharacterized metal-binding protein
MGCDSNNNGNMNGGNETFSLAIEATKGICPAGEKAVSVFRSQGRAPVFSCEGPCIRGEIARLAANAVSKTDGFARACHGEAFTVPHSAMAQWVNESNTVVVIDGCFLKCHARILRGIVDAKALVEFDALPFYSKYTDYFDIDSVPEEDRNAAARQVTDGVIQELKQGQCAKPGSESVSCCGKGQ